MACYENGCRYATRSLILFALAKPGQSVCRLGVAASRKMGSAVRRNRLKRVIKEFFRLHQDRFPSELDVVVVPKRGLDVKEFDLSRTREELLPLLLRLAGSPGSAGGGRPESGRPRSMESTAC